MSSRLWTNDEQQMRVETNRRDAVTVVDSAVIIVTLTLASPLLHPPLAFVGPILPYLRAQLLQRRRQECRPRLLTPFQPHR